MHGHLRRRADLIIVPRRHGSRRYWVVKDPIALRYFLLRDEEYALLWALDGKTSESQVRKRFESENPTRRLSATQWHRLLARFHRDGLVESPTGNQAESLFRRSDKRRWRRWSTQWGNLLAIRFHGIDPDPFLEWSYPKFRWLFSTTFVTACIVLMTSACVLAIGNSGQFAASLAEWRTDFTPTRLFIIAMVVAMVKIMHELAHALTCKHFGGECHEIGLMLLCFIPCLYCNVSDSWMMSHKWHRIAVAVAGIFVELVIASAATWLWFFSQPGLLNTTSFVVILVCSLSTIVLNANPLMRFDGYYVLSDAVGIPNLWHRSRALIAQAVLRNVIGIRAAPGSPFRERSPYLLTSYALLSGFYRWAVVLGILWIVFDLLSTTNLQFLYPVLLTSVLWAMVGQPVRNFYELLNNPVVWSTWQWWRLIASAAVVGLVLFLACVIPFPCRVHGEAVIKASNAKVVFVSMPGRLRSIVNEGQYVRQGEPIAELENLEAQREVAELSSRLEQQSLYLRGLLARQALDPTVGKLLPTAKEMKNDLNQRLEQLRRELESLELNAPRSGVVMRAESDEPNEGNQWSNDWTRSPLDAHNLNCYLGVGSPLCVVGDPNELVAVLRIKQTDLEQVQIGQRVWLRLEPMRGRVIHGVVSEIAQSSSLVRASSEMPRMDRRTAEFGDRSTNDRMYQVKARIDKDARRHLMIGVHGRAKIAVQPQSIAWRLAKYCRQAFGR